MSYVNDMKKQITKEIENMKQSIIWAKEHGFYNRNHDLYLQELYDRYNELNSICDENGKEN